MAGMKGRSGGARVGAGRKPLSVNERRLRGRPIPVPAAVDPASGAVAAGPMAMPDDLPELVAGVWKRMAPLAIAEGTLDSVTAFAFERLCHAIVLEDELSKDHDKRGGSDHRGVMQRLEVQMARFRLTPDGKPRTVAQKPKELSPLEKLQAKAAEMRRPVKVS